MGKQKGKEESDKRLMQLLETGNEYKLLIPGYPEGSDITIINTTYVKPQKDDEGNYKKDYISILFRDNITGEKKIHFIYEPLYTFYKLKDDQGFGSLDHNLFFVEKDKVEPVTCRYTDILKKIATITGNLDTYYDNIRNRNMSANDDFHMIPDIFCSAIHIEDYYRFLFGLSYKNEPFELNKAYLDIETDGRYALGDFPDPGEVPINAVAYHDERSNKVYQFIFDDPRNPLIKPYKALSNKKSQMEKLKNFVINAVGGYKKAVRFGVDILSYEILFFQNEWEMLKALFNTISITCPDVLLIWNMAFDLSYIAARAETLGHDPMELLCDTRIKQRFFRFYVDERNKNDFEERGDYVKLSSYTVWLDQMIQFASRRKGRAAYQSFKLDSIGEVVAKVHKLDYSRITNDINMLPYLDFETFSFYNIMDVIVQKCIEKSTQDCEYVFTKCIVNNTRFEKCHRQSAYLSNRFMKDFYEYGFILGNNRNKGREKPKEKYPGAMVHDLTKNSIYAMVWINGRPTLLANNVIDFDFSALYPSIILEFNMAPNTQLGRLIIEEDIHDKENHDMYTSDEEFAKYSRGGEFLENMMSGNILEFCCRWLHLGDFFEVQDDICEYYKYNSYSGKPIDYDETKDSIFFTKDKQRDAIVFVDKYSNFENVIRFKDELSIDEKSKLIEEIKKGAIL